MADHVRTADRASGSNDNPDDARDGAALRAAFRDRAIAVVDRLAGTVDEPRLKAALDADTDAAVLTALGLTQDPASSASTTGTDPLAAARARGEQAKRDILAAQGYLWRDYQVAELLGLPESAVKRRREAGRLLALPLDDGTWVFPGWQFTGNGLMPGLEDVLRSLTAPDPWSRVLFFQSGDPFFNGQTPLELIRRGEIETVRRLAAAYDELVAT
jgi:hypothetical protein